MTIITGTEVPEQEETMLQPNQTVYYVPSSACHHLLACANQTADRICGIGDLDCHIFHPAADDLRGILGVIGSGEAQQAAHQAIALTGHANDGIAG